MAGRRAVVITIDPAKRLATSLGLKGLSASATDLTANVNDVMKAQGAPPLAGKFFAVMPDTAQTFERFVRSIKEECLDRMIFFGEQMLRETILSYVERYHAERNHQGLDNKLIDPVDDIGKADGKIVCRERLGGLLKSYHRRTA